MHQRYLGTNVCHVRVKNERFTAADSRCRQKISRRHLVGYVKKIAPKSVLHVQHDYFSSFKQMKSLIGGVDVVVLIIISLSPCKGVSFPITARSLVQFF